VALTDAAGQLGPAFDSEQLTTEELLDRVRQARQHAHEPSVTVRGPGGSVLASLRTLAKPKPKRPPGL